MQVNAMAKEDMTGISGVVSHISKPERRDILAVQSAVLKATHDFLWRKGVLQMMPVMLSTITDPLNHPVHDSSLVYAGRRLQLTRSMILHKQLAMVSPAIRGIYIVSPNVRLEMDALRETGRHLCEFSQVDIELKAASAGDFMRLTDDLFVHVFSFVKKECESELGRLGRKLTVPRAPFRVFDSSELRGKYGDDFEHILSERESAPFWITDYYREFYDRQDPLTGKHVNYDIFYPEGYGEGLSGAERETDYETIMRKMRERKMDSAPYAPFLEFAKKGLLRPSAGGGFGVERMVRYITGRKHIRDVVFFPRVPGETFLV